MDRVRSRARTVVVGVLGGVGHVGLVVGRVEVDTIPARWEEDLGTETVRALLGREAVGVGRSAAVVQADVADSLLGKVVATGSEGGSTGKHTETLGEGSDVVVVGTASLQVVDGHTALDTLTVTRLRNQGVGSVLLHVVQRRGPVVGHVLLDGARGASGRLSALVVHSGSKAIATSDGVDVSRHATGADDGVETFLGETARARHTPEGVSWCRKGSQAGGSRDQGVDLHVSCWVSAAPWMPLPGGTGRWMIVSAESMRKSYKACCEARQ